MALRLAFTCECGKQLKASERDAGQTIACPDCGVEHAVPAVPASARKKSRAPRPPAAVASTSASVPVPAKLAFPGGRRGMIAGGLAAVALLGPAGWWWFSESESAVAAKLRELLPAATSIHPVEWEVCKESGSAPKLSEFENQSVTAVIIANFPTDESPISKAFVQLRPTPRDIMTAFRSENPEEPVTAVRPSFITAISCKLSGGAATGVISYTAPGRYRGTLDYTARRQGLTWGFTEFRFPGSAIKIVRGLDGHWIQR